MNKLYEVVKQFAPNVREEWPIGSWVFVQSHFDKHGIGWWYFVGAEGRQIRKHDELSEAEANALGIFRKVK